jgi:hypothetical protein
LELLLSDSGSNNSNSGTTVEAQDMSALSEATDSAAKAANAAAMSARGSYDKDNFADGGRPGLIKGPGTGISDSIHAKGPGGSSIRVSNNEYILPADTVAAVGVDTLNRLVAETHVPAAMQRAMFGE